MIVLLEDLPSIKAANADARIGFVVGSFDILHGGHLDYLEWASKHCDRLFVCIRSDRRVRQIKGSDRPVMPQDTRARIIDALSCTDFTYITDDDIQSEKPSITVARYVRPDVIILGNDWGHEEPLWRKSLPASQIVVCPIPWRESTTSIIDRIRLSQ